MTFRFTVFRVAILCVTVGGRVGLADEPMVSTPRLPPASAVSAHPVATPPAPGAAENSAIEVLDAPEPPKTFSTSHPEADEKAPADDRRVPLEASWENGLHLASKDDRFDLHFGAIVQIDSVGLIGPHSVFAAPGGGDNNVGNAQATQIRRAILAADGQIWELFDYSVAFDFANASNDNSGLQPPSFGNLSSSPAPLNVWLQVREVPYLGNVRAGNQVKPIGMVNNTSGANLGFMERPDNHDTFYAPFDNGHALGLTAQNWTESQRATWRYGIFQPATNVFGVALNKYAVGARITTLPWYVDDGERLVHLGLGYWGGDLVEDQRRNRARPLLRNAPGFAVPILADTGEIPGRMEHIIAPEFALVLGPLSVQAEYAAEFLSDATPAGETNIGTIFYHGGYVEALYFLTGEHAEYVRRDGVFGRVIPRTNFHWRKNDCCRGSGAWQIGVRFSYLDLDDKSIQGGQIYDWTAGVNWYLNPNMKVQCNYIAEHRDTPGVTPGWINGIGVRAGYSF